MSDDLRDRIAQAIRQARDPRNLTQRLIDESNRQADAVLAMLAEQTDFDPDSPEASAYFTGYQDGYSAADTAGRLRRSASGDTAATSASGDVDVLRAHIRLTQWKAEALGVLAVWDRVWETLGRPGTLGESKAEAALATAEWLMAQSLSGPVRTITDTKGQG